ncbi:MAG: M23 family metallopeptidase [Lachnospiraceae bacterium]|nr:M23 family metallopeptidase [Lachnospiraceae bacterium]
MKLNRKTRWAHIWGLLAAVFVCILFFPTLVIIESKGENVFHIRLNGTDVGVYGDRDVSGLLRRARLAAARESADMLLADTDIEITGEEKWFGEVDSASTIVGNMTAVLKKSRIETMQRAYTVKVNQYMVNLGGADEVLNLLNAVIGKYDEKHEYKAELVTDPTRELNVLTTHVIRTSEAIKNAKEAAGYVREAGAEALMNTAFDEIEPDVELDFSDYDQGVLTMDFADPVEVVECYLPDESLTSLQTAIEQVTKEQEKNKIYEVVSGDTLSEIAENNGLSLDDLIAINPGIESASSTIRVGDEIIVTSPEPELSVVRSEQLYYEEDYDEDIIYLDNDDWYTNDMVTRQQPSCGHRKVIGVITYKNSAEAGREIVKEEVMIKAVPKIVERGTKIPPTYIKPISGGRFTSGFGRRKAPKKGASTYHKGVDWATPVGTAVMASCGGTVVKAGWASGYGNVIFINHIDGRQTRYGHLSRVLVKPGQKVNQGQKIALSGNTGVSTGPHVHFEILIGGSQVNPLNYLS